MLGCLYLFLERTVVYIDKLSVSMYVFAQSATGDIGGWLVSQEREDSVMAIAYMSTAVKIGSSSDDCVSAQKEK